MNWGYKILMVYVIFIAGILLLVFKSSSQNQDLVTEDYYEQELKYQQKIDETQRANALSTEVKYKIINNGIVINFPPEMKGAKLTAHVLLYCTAEQSKDIQKELATDNAQLYLALPQANKGLHELRINWMVNGTSYYYQHKIIIP